MLHRCRLFKDEFNINIQNVVASADLHQSIDLESIAKTFPAVKYKPDQFPGLVYHVKKPNAAILIFSTGKLIIAGAKSEKRATRAVSKLIEELRTGGSSFLGNLT